MMVAGVLRGAGVLLGHDGWVAVTALVTSVVAGAVAGAVFVAVLGVLVTVAEEMIERAIVDDCGIRFSCLLPSFFPI